MKACFALGLLLSVHAHALTYEHWCEDLMGGSANESSTACSESLDLIRSLGSDETSLRLVLNETLFAHVERCARIRAQGEGAPVLAFAVRTCQLQSPLLNVAKDLKFIRADTNPPPQFPPSGARFVVDCTGRHIQMRGDLPPARQRALLRTVFDKVSAPNLAQTLQSLQKSASSERRIEARSCEISSDTDIKANRFHPSVWSFSARGITTIEVSDVPLSYISKDCTTPATKTAADSQRMDAKDKENGIRLPQNLAQRKVESFRATLLELKKLSMECRQIRESVERHEATQEEHDECSRQMKNLQDELVEMQEK